MIKRPIELMLAHVRPGDLRDHLLRRHFRMDAFGNLGRPFLDAGEVERKEIAAEVADMCERWLTDGVRERLPAIDRSRIAALQDIDRLVRLAHIESASVRRELTALRWEREREREGEGRLAISGRVSLSTLERYDRPEITGGDLALVLRRRHADPGPSDEVVVPVTGDCAGFTGIVDVTTLSSGIWDVHVSVAFEGVPRLARLGADGEGLIAPPAPRVVGDVVALPYFTHPYGNLSLDIGGHVVAVPGSVRLVRARWAAGHRLVLDGEVSVGATAPAANAVRYLVWRERESSRERREPVTVGEGGRFTACQAMGRLGPGTWDAYLELDLGGPPARFRIEAVPEVIEHPRTWWRGAIRWSVRPYATAGRAGSARWSAPSAPELSSDVSCVNATFLQQQAYGLKLGANPHFGGLLCTYPMAFSTPPSRCRREWWPPPAWPSACAAPAASWTTAPLRWPAWSPRSSSRSRCSTSRSPRAPAGISSGARSPRYSSARTQRCCAWPWSSWCRRSSSPTAG